VIDKSISLFEDETSCYIVEEAYVELRGQNGETEFVTLIEKESPFTGKTSSLKGLPTVPWRIKR
jgi:hypothetical protein